MDDDLFCVAGGDGAEPAAAPVVWLAVLSVPDESRFPLPEQFSLNSVPVDLSGLDEKSGGEVRSLVTPTLPTEQLLQIEIAERGRQKPRGMVLRAIQSERENRGTGFESWVAGAAASPIQSRIAALAWAVGDCDPEVISPGLMDGEASERDALQECFLQVTNLASESGIVELRAWDLPSVCRMLQARSVACGSKCLFSASGVVPGWSAVDSFWPAHVASHGGLRAAALAFGGVDAEIVPVPSAVEVFLEFRREPGSVKLQDWVSGLLSLQRDMLQQMAGFVA